MIDVRTSFKKHRSKQSERRSESRNCLRDVRIRMPESLTWRIEPRRVPRSVREMKNSQMCRHSEYSVSGVKNFVVVFKSWMLRYTQHDKQLPSFWA